MTRHALLLIPGINQIEQHQQRDRFVAALTTVPETATVIHSGAARVEGAEGVALTIQPNQGPAMNLDVYEAFWGDLIPRLSELPLRSRVWGGARLLGYWGLSSIWRHMLGHKYLMLWLVGSSVVLLAWYLGILLMFFSAVGSDPNLLLGQESTADPAVQSILDQIARGLGRLGQAMGEWRLWALVALLMLFVPIDRLVNLADFTRAYLINEPSGQDFVGLRDRIRNRVRSRLVHLDRAGRYDSITVVAHSFGCVIAVEVLAGYTTEGCPIRLLTLGGPLEVLGYREPWIKREIADSLVNERLTRWQDYHLRGDWFCTATPVEGQPAHFESRPLLRESSFLQRLQGRPHQAYLGEQEIIHDIIRIG